jgi:hypothetical protein
VSRDAPRAIDDAPSLETLREVARYRGLVFNDDQLSAAAESYAAFWPKLLRLRAVRLDYLPPIIEPGDAVAWIENGGKRRA